MLLAESAYCWPWCLYAEYGLHIGMVTRSSIACLNREPHSQVTKEYRITATESSAVLLLAWYQWLIG